ncbi:helix-turn-helix domain-containing protein [Flammeovirgaceae bacterium SG7u.111]|nr:helix-turn-helix domain-containing protein [Flammeovirgaceae bacterium SG7u.132]WPO33316.1 helix-turn-helix domain-containing protein [Flammeovirgaceae bacterium SG7u.111]
MEGKKTRQLAAVMFTDIVGYTALMQGDEARAIRMREKHREVFQEQHGLHNGNIIQYYGDGTLSIFKSALEAVKCAIAVQKLLQEGEVIPLRIGLHMGDIVFNETEVFGDGVNLAARVESMGIAGGILLSGKLNDELKNQTDISTVSLGSFNLKNVEQPIEIFAVSSEGMAVPQPTELKGKQEPGKTIAVLPFVNMSTSEENEYFSDGITEEIINALAKINSLKVTSRTSSFFFKNKNIPITEIAAELGVAVVLEGSVRRAGDMVRITAQLIQAADDFHFWSETWDRKLENIFEVQDEISLLIADKLREHFGHFEIEDHLVEKQTDSIAAYDDFLKGKYHYNKWNPEDAKTAMGFYEKALELDPSHAESLAGLADCYGFLATTGFLPYVEAWEKAATLAKKALGINEQSPDAYYQLANYAFFISCDYKESLELAMKAAKLQPNYIEAQHFLLFLYIIAGKKELGRKQLELVMSIDPLSPETLFYNGYYHYIAEEYATSLEYFDKCLAQNPRNIPAHSVKCYCLLKLNRPNDVLGYFEKLPPEIVVEGDKLGSTALAYAVMGDKENTERYLSILEEEAKTPEGFRAHSFLFMMYALTGAHEKAFEWIEQSIENNSSFLLFHFADPLVDSLKSDLRHDKYQQLIFPKELFESTSKKKKALLDEETTELFTKRLLAHLVEEKPYLDPFLTLRTLAEQIDIHPNQLSWLLNENMGKNFNEFINSYRVEEFKKLSQDPKKSHITLMGLAYESGFNSKTVFNTYFKKETGLTPKQFLKSIK